MRSLSLFELIMAIINHPQQTVHPCYAVFDREYVLRQDGQPLTMADLNTLEAWQLQENVTPDLFEEEENDICVLALRTKEHLPEGYRLGIIREVFALGNEAETLRLARAKALAGWRQNSAYCPRCGALMQEHPTMTARECPACQNLVFPRIDPCVITVVSRPDGKILLAKHVQRNQNIYACIAGFIEAGETVEQAVAREVMEETGLKIKNVRYYGSQSWPFPSQLMLGYTAEYDGGDIHLQAEELSDAQWFDRDNCPASPQPGSIAYRLIHQC